MPTGFLIKSVANVRDGLHLAVTLDGTPTGAVSFDCAPLPRRDHAVYPPVPVPASLQPDGTYLVAVPYPDIWYIWATDGQGRTDDPGAGYMGLSDDPDLNGVGAAVEGILTENIPGLNAALQTLLPNVTMKRVVYGSATAIDDYPAILVCKPRRSDRPYAMPYVFENTFSLEIMCLFRHGDKNSVLALGTSFAARVMDILKRPCYNQFTLPSGTQVADAYCRTGESDELQDDDSSFVNIGSLLWSANAFIQTPI